MSTQRFQRMDFVDFGRGRGFGTVFEVEADGYVLACVETSHGRMVRFVPASGAQLIARDFKNVTKEKPDATLRSHEGD